MASNFHWRFHRLRGSHKRKAAELIRGETNMLDAIQISFALWGMILCGSIKAVQLAHAVF
jgi:hypothetical protein